jgi:hypothetical protein
VGLDLQRERLHLAGTESPQLMRGPLAGLRNVEEYVYATTASQGGSPIRAELDNNGRWIDQLGASVAEDGSWVRFHVTDPRGPAAGRYRYFSVAFVAIRTGTVIRSAYARSTEEERAAGWFRSSAILPTEQSMRGHPVMWRPCADA